MFNINIKLVLTILQAIPLMLIGLLISKVATGSILTYVVIAVPAVTLMVALLYFHERLKEKVGSPS